MCWRVTCAGRPQRGGGFWRLGTSLRFERFILGRLPFLVGHPAAERLAIRLRIVILQKRDRLSYAVLNQVSGQYRGQFLDNKLTVEIGLTAKFFKRDLTNYCFTSSSGGFVECFGRDATLQGQLAGFNPYSYTPAAGNVAAVVTGWAVPQNRVYNYKRVLPSGGLTFKFSPQSSVFVNYSKGIQVPGTDNLYNAFFFPRNAPQAKRRQSIASVVPTTSFRFFPRT